MSPSPRCAPVGVIVVMVVIAMGLGSCSSTSSATSTRHQRWDPRLSPIAKQVEKFRHLRFKRSVPATFLSASSFRKRVTSDDSKVSRKDRRDLQAGEAELRTLGLVDGSFDLLKTTDAVSGSGVLAYHDPGHKDIVVRGKKIDAETRVTLAHELTHALQDQHYNLKRLRDGAKTSGADDAVVALVEGDAARIEAKYYFALSPREQRFVDQAEGAASGRTGPKSPDAPTAAGEAANGVVAASFESPYAFGPPLVEVILAAKGRRGLAAAFHHPPTTQLQLLVPTRSITVAALPSLRRPKLRAGARRFGSDQPDDFGAVDLYFLLSSRLPAAVSLQAADAWGNGKELISGTKTKTCVDVKFAARDRAGALRIGGALRLWAAAMPAGAITLADDGLSIRGCDPGKSAVGPPNAAATALGVAAVRSSFVSDLVRGGAPGPIAACIGDRIIDGPEFAAAVAGADEQREPTMAEVASLSAAIEALIPGCS